MLSIRRRAALAACLGLAALWLAGRAALLGPRTVEIPEARLQQASAHRFPLKSRVLELFDINVGAPRLGQRRLDSSVAMGWRLSYPNWSTCWI